MSLVEGDKHGEFSNTLSYARHPELRELEPQDVMLILGDCGLPFGVNASWYKSKCYKHDKYEIEWCAKKPFTWIFLCGNHDDRDAIAHMPIVEKWGGKVRQMKFDNKIYNNIFYIDTPQILDICDRHCLCIPGAHSHDADIVLDPNHYRFKSKMFIKLKKENALFRINHWTWWKDEDVDCKAVCNLLNTNENMYQYYDYVFSHESPAVWEYSGYSGGPRYNITTAQDYLEVLREELIFYRWFHGHQHQDLVYPMDERITCLFHDVIEL